jgi:zinc protease
MVVATPKPGQPPEKLLAEIDEELARLAAKPPSAEELQRAKNKVESQMIFALEPVGGFGGRAATLNHYWLLTGDPGYFAKDLARYRAVTPADVQAAVARYLRKDARVVLTVLPGTKKGGES